MIAMKDQLLALGWKLCHNSAGEETLVRFSTPRIGWKTDGTLIVGYYEWPDKVHTMEELEFILENL